MYTPEDELKRLQRPGDEVWIEQPYQVKKTSYGVPYHDFVKYRVGGDGQVREVDRKHYDPDDEDFIIPL